MGFDLREPGLPPALPPRPGIYGKCLTGLQPVDLGWFIPNTTSLLAAVKNAQRNGRRVIVRVAENNIMWFVAEWP